MNLLFFHFQRCTKGLIDLLHCSLCFPFSNLFVLDKEVLSFFFTKCTEVIGTKIYVRLFCELPFVGNDVLNVINRVYHIITYFYYKCNFTNKPVSKKISRIHDIQYNGTNKKQYLPRLHILEEHLSHLVSTDNKKYIYTRNVISRYINHYQALP